MQAKLKDASAKLESITKKADIQDGVISLVKTEKAKLLRKIRSLSKQPTADESVLQEVLDLEKPIKALNQENKELGELVALLESPDIVTVCYGKYSNEIYETIMNLLSMDVAMSKVNFVIKAVLQKLAGKSLYKLPSHGTINRFMVEANMLAKT